MRLQAAALIAGLVLVVELVTISMLAPPEPEVESQGPPLGLINGQLPSPSPRPWLMRSLPPRNCVPAFLEKGAGGANETVRIFVKVLDFPSSRASFDFGSSIPRQILGWLDFEVPEANISRLLDQVNWRLIVADCQSDPRAMLREFDICLENIQGRANGADLSVDPACTIPNLWALGAWEDGTVHLTIEGPNLEENGTFHGVDVDWVYLTYTSFEVTADQARDFLRALIEDPAVQEIDASGPAEFSGRT